jgi:hypothetical protein
MGRWQTPRVGRCVSPACAPGRAGSLRCTRLRRRAAIGRGPQPSHPPCPARAHPIPYPKPKTSRRRLDLASAVSLASAALASRSAPAAAPAASPRAASAAASASRRSRASCAARPCSRWRSRRSAAASAWARASSCRRDAASAAACGRGAARRRELCVVPPGGRSAPGHAHGAGGDHRNWAAATHLFGGLRLHSLGALGGAAPLRGGGGGRAARRSAAGGPARRQTKLPAQHGRDRLLRGEGSEGLWGLLTAGRTRRVFFNSPTRAAAVRARDARTVARLSEARPCRARVSAARSPKLHATTTTSSAPGA